MHFAHLWKFIFVSFVGVLFVVPSFFAASTNFRFPKDKNLQHKIWIWIKTTSSGEKMILAKNKAFRLQFLDSHQVQIFTDCNTASADYIYQANFISFSNLLQTRKACPFSQEKEFLRDLSLVKTIAFKNRKKHQQMQFLSSSGRAMIFEIFPLGPSSIFTP